MKNVFLAVCCSAAVFACAADIEWNAANRFGEPEYLRCAGKIESGLLVITDIDRDSHITLGNLAIDPKAYDGFACRYRATGTGKGGGQLYFSWARNTASDRRRLNLPQLIADGQWHEYEVHAKDAACAASWFGGGFIRELRFDPTDAAGGRIEIEWLKLLAAPGQPTAAVRTVAEPPPPPGHRDDGIPWPPVRRVWAEDPGEPTTAGRLPAFPGEAVTAPDDHGQGGAFSLSRKIALKDKPAMAWVQAFADAHGSVKVNGTVAARASYRRGYGFLARFSREGVIDLVKPGTNEIVLEYTSDTGYTGAALMELYVRYADGTDERFVTGPGFIGTNGCAAICRPPPPAAPWGFVPEYCDYAVAQRALGGGAETPEVVAGGETVLRYRFQGSPPEGRFTVTVMLGCGVKTPAWREDITLNARDHVVPHPDGTWELAAPFTAPLYFTAGEYTVQIVSGAFPVLGGESGSSTLKIIAAEDCDFPHPTAATVKKINGVPEFHFNGRPRFVFWGGTQGTKRPDRQMRLGDLPVDLVTVYADMREWHPAIGVWDFSAFDRVAELYRRANPSAYFAWDFTITPPKDWPAKYPDEMCRDERGVQSADGGRPNFSFFSKVAIEEMKETVSRAIDHLEKSPYANRIVAYRMNSGHTIEWLGWRPEPGHIFDFSPAAQKSFRAYAEEFYPALKDFAIPGPAARAARDGDDLLWNPARHLGSIAFVECHSRQIAEDVLEMCGHVKKELAARGREKLVGTYYGYIATLNANGVSQMRGHYALKRLLEGPRVVDYLMSPQNYGQRNLGDTCGEMKPFATLQAHGIVSVIEDDTRTHNYTHGEWHSYYQTPTVRLSREIMRRNLAVHICRREPAYLYALCGGRDFDFPEVAADARLVKAVGERLTAKGAKRAAEVAVVVSEKAIVASPMNTRRVPAEYMSRDYDRAGNPVRRAQSVALPEGDLYNDNYSRFARSGVAFDLVLAEDLADNPGDYRVYIFENCFVQDAAFAQAVKKLQARDCTLVWLYAPGYTKGLEQSLDNMRDLTGLRFGRFAAPAVSEVIFADGRKMGVPDEKVSPLFFVADTCDVLAKYADGSAGVVRTKTGRATTYFSGPWRMDVPFAREIWAQAGIHVWCASEDPVEANDRLVTLHARSAGVKTIHLPRKTTVVDIFNRRVVAHDATSFSFSAPLHSSHLFYYGDDAEDMLAALF